MPTRAQEFATAVVRLNRRMRKERRTELTPTQLAALGSLRMRGPQTVGELACREGVRPPSMTRTVAALVESGLAVRSPHPSDGRQVVVSITDQGEKTLAVERERRDEWLGAQLAKLSKEERQTLTAAAKIMNSMAAR